MTKIKYKGEIVATLESNQKAVLHLRDKKLTGDIDIVAPAPVEEWDGSVVIEGGVELISFIFASTIYQAEAGMTWREWVNSTYNTAGFYEHFLDGVYCVGVRSGSAGSGYGVAYNDAFVSLDDLIVEGREYTEKHGVHSGGSIN